MSSKKKASRESPIANWTVRWVKLSKRRVVAPVSGKTAENGGKTRKPQRRTTAKLSSVHEYTERGGRESRLAKEVTQKSWLWMNNVCVDVTLTAFTASTAAAISHRTHLKLLCTNYLSLVLTCACSSSYVCACVCVCITGVKWQLHLQLPRF